MTATHLLRTPCGLRVIGVTLAMLAFGCGGQDSNDPPASLDDDSSTVDATADFAPDDVPMNFDFGPSPDVAGGEVWCPAVDFTDRLTAAQKPCPYWEEFNAPPPDGGTNPWKCTSCDDREAGIVNAFQVMIVGRWLECPWRYRNPPPDSGLPGPGDPAGGIGEFPIPGGYGVGVGSSGYIGVEFTSDGRTYFLRPDCDGNVVRGTDGPITYDAGPLGVVGDVWEAWYEIPNSGPSSGLLNVYYTPDKKYPFSSLPFIELTPKRWFIGHVFVPAPDRI